MIDHLTFRGERPGKLDLALAALFCAGSVFYMSQDLHRAGYGVTWFAVAAFPLVFVPLAWRRAAPLAAVGATLALLLAHTAVFGEIVRCGIILPLAFILAFSVGARLDRRQSLLGLALALGIALSISLFDGPHGAPLDAFPMLVPIIAVIWGAGRLVRSRGRIAAELAARTRELRSTRDRRARLEVTADRARVSAELDDLLRRRLGELASLAETGGHDGDPVAAAGALQAIEVESRRTLDQMRTAVGVLRSDSDDDERAPQPTLTHLEALLLRTRGGDAHLTVEGSPRVLPAGVELSAYRIVEHLLDALHDVPVDVAVRFGDDALELVVSGPSRRPNPEAIRRAQERVQLHRGTLRSSSRGGRAEAVASLPMLVGA